MNLRQAAQQALEAMDNLHRTGDTQVFDLCHRETTEALRAALAEPEQEPMRLRRGDILRCIETDELCTVWTTSTTGKTLIKWSANNFGEYTAAQIGELFWVEPRETEQEPVAWMYDCGNGGRMYAEELDGVKGWAPLYTAPPQRKPLTEEEIEQAYRNIWRNIPENFDHASMGWIEQGIRYAEQAHGIKGKA